MIAGPIPGCKPCTNSEMTYCKDGRVINDHCCCDGSFNSRYSSRYITYKTCIFFFLIKMHSHNSLCKESSKRDGGRDRLTLAFSRTTEIAFSAPRPSFFYSRGQWEVARKTTFGPRTSSGANSCVNNRGNDARCATRFTEI